MPKFDLRLGAIERAVSEMEAAPPPPEPIRPDMTWEQAAASYEAALARYRPARDRGETSSDEDSRDAYSMILNPSPDYNYRVDHALTMLLRWQPGIWDIPANQRGPWIGRLKGKLEQLGDDPYVSWTVNQVFTRLQKGRKLQ
jgi:hypothetical protein